MKRTVAARRSSFVFGLAGLVGLGCGPGAEAPPAVATAAPPPAPAPAETAPAATGFARVPRADFNRLAAAAALPIFWTSDANADGALDPSELAVYWGLVPGATLAEYVDQGAFTAKAKEAYELIAKSHAAPPSERQAAQGSTEEARRAAVMKELAQGRVTLITTDLSKAPAEDKAFVAHIVKVAELIDRLYRVQLGTEAFAKSVPEGDAASRTVFFRNNGFKCEAPATENDPSCSALPLAATPKGKVSGLYPTDLLASESFCADLAKKKDKPVGNEFTVVVKNEKGELEAKPYTVAYKAEMQEIARELEAAAKALGATEPALRAYLGAAAKAFVTNDWWPADAAWAKMDATSSKYYLRVAPDEVYDEPCNIKALFHVSFGLINQGSLTWQRKLDPRKAEMEKALAEMAGAPYKARDVKFKLPDFVDVAINAGDSRKAFGATIGQSLPNVGPVAKKGGRTVAMTNLYADPDSVAAFKQQAESLFCKDTLARYTTSPEPQVMSTVLHEAAHNLGPAHEYAVNGKVDRAIFGGPLASTLEELKAQTSALFFTDWLADKDVITRDEADKAHVRDVFWAFGHISRGMYTEDKKPKNYSQLAAIQLGTLMKAGAVTFKKDEKAGNGADAGCFSVDASAMPKAIEALMKDVAEVKGRGDKARAEGFVKEHVDIDQDADKRAIRQIITERMARAPKASFVYTIKTDESR